MPHRFIFLRTVLYEMATGALPFPGETSATIFERYPNRLRCRDTVESDSTPKLEDIINKLLEKDDRTAYQAAAELEASQTAQARPESGRLQVQDSAAVLRSSSNVPRRRRRAPPVVRPGRGRAPA